MIQKMFRVATSAAPEVIRLHLYEAFGFRKNLIKEVSSGDAMNTIYWTDEIEKEEVYETGILIRN